jgi:hypothetical protein
MIIIIMVIYLARNPDGLAFFTETSVRSAVQKLGFLTCDNLQSGVALTIPDVTFNSLLTSSKLQRIYFCNRMQTFSVSSDLSMK